VLLKKIYKKVRVSKMAAMHREKFEATKKNQELWGDLELQSRKKKGTGKHGGREVMGWQT